MCGIAGLFSMQRETSTAERQRIASAMSDALHARGPDSSGVWSDPDTALTLAHRRLAILDLSADGHQPMISASGRYVISYNGEIYNYQDLQNQLNAHDINFKGRSDTEVILAAIDHWGLNAALQKLNGMFAIALWDLKTKDLHLIRDRAGKKPLYFGWTSGENGKRKDFVFASELKALRAHPKFEARINRTSLNAYLQKGAMPAPYCIYENVWMLPPAHRVTIQTQTLGKNTNILENMQCYWDIKAIIDSKRTGAKETYSTDKDCVDNFETLLSQCVQERMISDVPLGAFLSGGIDSSAVVALMQRHSAAPIKTFTIGFEEAGFNEAEYAKTIAEHLGTDHHELYLNASETRDIIPNLPAMYDEPFGDISAIPTYLVSKFARQSVTVALSGDGGDEVLGGYNRHITAPAIWNKMKYCAAPLRSALGSLLQTMPTALWDTLNPKHPQFGTRLHKAAEIFKLKDKTQIYDALTAHWGHSDELALHSLSPDLAKEHPKNLNFAEQMMVADFKTYLPDTVLTKVDRASMAISLEARAPLLDQRIFEHVWGLPHHVKIRDGKGKWLLREMLTRHVPSDLFERPKQGFTMPVGTWLRGDLKDWAEDLLDETALKNDGYLDVSTIRSAWDEHLKGKGNHANKLWTVLMFQAWKRHWL